jgi:hypothetical protein
MTATKMTFNANDMQWGDYAKMLENMIESREEKKISASSELKIFSSLFSNSPIVLYLLLKSRIKVKWNQKVSDSKKGLISKVYQSRMKMKSKWKFFLKSIKKENQIKTLKSLTFAFKSCLL